MDRLLKVFNNLNFIASEISESVLHDECTCAKAKKVLISGLCHSINRFASIDIDTYVYVFPCTLAIRQLNDAKNSEKVVHVCLEIIKWTAETIHELNESEAD